MSKSSEHWRKVSFVNEDEINAFFNKFCGWKLIAKRVDLSVTGGIDALFQIFNPFRQKIELILVESKHIEGGYLSPTKLEDQIYILKDQVERFRDSPEQIKSTFNVAEIEGDMRYGIIVHRFEDFEYERFQNLLQRIIIREKKQYNPPIIYLLNNYHISRYIEVYLRNKKQKLYWFYLPFNQNYNLTFYKSPIPNFLFSDYGFLLTKNSDYEDQYLYDSNEKDIIFFLDAKPTIRCGEFISSLFQKYPIKLENIKKIYFFKGDHNELENYELNLFNCGLDVKKSQLVICKINDKFLADLRGIFE